MEAKATEGPRGRLCAFGAAGRPQPSFENVAANEKPRSLAEISPASLDSVVDSESLLSADGCDAEPRLWSELCPVRLAVPAESVRVSERARPCAVSPTPCIAPPMPCTMPSTPDCITSRALRTASPTGSLLASDSSDRALADSSDAALAFFARASAALLTIALILDRRGRTLHAVPTNGPPIRDPYSRPPLAPAPWPNISLTCHTVIDT